MTYSSVGLLNEWQGQFFGNQKMFETYQPVAGNDFGPKYSLSQEAIAYLSTWYLMQVYCKIFIAGVPV